MPKSLMDFVEEAQRSVRDVSPTEAMELIRTGSWTLVDVREPFEYLHGHLESAINIPRGLLEMKADAEAPKRDPRLQDRSKPVLLYCGAGKRSAMAGHTLRLMGFEEVARIAGGWHAWVEAGLPYATPYDP